MVTSDLVSVTTTNSGALALKYFGTWNGLYDIVMADFHIADMNLYEFIQSIRDQCLRGIKFNYLSHNTICLNTI